MLTLKLINTKEGRTRIIECGAVDVVRKNGVVKVVATTTDGEKMFQVGNGEGYYDVAYVENGRGATSQTIRADR